MNLRDDRRIVMTLDAGGTNLKFSAIRGAELLPGAISIPTAANDLPRCLADIVEGFTRSRGAVPRAARGHQLRLSRPGRLSRGRDRRPAQSAGVPRRRGAGADDRRQVRHPRAHQQRRRPVRLRRGDGRLPSLRQRAVGGGRQPEALPEPLRPDARHRPRRRHRTQRRVADRRQFRRRRSLAAAQQARSGAERRGGVHRSAPSSGSTRRRPAWPSSRLPSPR